MPAVAQLRNGPKVAFQPLRQRGQDHGRCFVNGAGVLSGSAAQGLGGPAVAPTLPTRCGIRLCAGAVLKNPLETLRANDNAPSVIQPGDNGMVIVGPLGPRERGCGDHVHGLGFPVRWDGRIEAWPIRPARTMDEPRSNSVQPSSLFSMGCRGWCGPRSRAWAGFCAGRVIRISGYPRRGVARKGRLQGGPIDFSLWLYAGLRGRRINIRAGLTCPRCSGCACRRPPYK
jgi:hypothetical protein